MLQSQELRASVLYQADSLASMTRIKDGAFVQPEQWRLSDAKAELIGKLHCMVSDEAFGTELSTAQEQLQREFQCLALTIFSKTMASVPMKSRVRAPTSVLHGSLATLFLRHRRPPSHRPAAPNCL
jgi:hypothetical protein